MHKERNREMMKGNHMVLEQKIDKEVLKKVKDGRKKEMSWMC